MFLAIVDFGLIPQDARLAPCYCPRCQRVECTSVHLSTHDRPADAGPLLRRRTTIWEPVQSTTERVCRQLRCAIPGIRIPGHNCIHGTLPVFPFHLLLDQHNRLNPNFPCPDQGGTAFFGRVSWALDAIAEVLRAYWKTCMLHTARLDLALLIELPSLQIRQPSWVHARWFRLALGSMSSAWPSGYSDLLFKRCT